MPAVPTKVPESDEFPDKGMAARFPWFLPQTTMFVADEALAVLLDAGQAESTVGLELDTTASKTSNTLTLEFNEFALASVAGIRSTPPHTGVRDSYAPIDQVAVASVEPATADAVTPKPASVPENRSPFPLAVYRHEFPLRVPVQFVGAVHPVRVQGLLTKGPVISTAPTLLPCVTVAFNEKAKEWPELFR